MHLEGPWLSTGGKKKGKQKYRNSEQARKAKQNEDGWNNLLKKWGVTEAPKRSKTATVEAYKPPAPYRRETPHIPSKITTWDPCTKAPDKVYTGTAMKGIGTMHKSNSVPIFSNEEAIEISRMRR
jgi:hypothetical protein